MSLRSKQVEDEYVARMEYLRKRSIEQEKHAKLKTQEKDRLKKVHYMRCPKCGMELIEINYNGILVDKCSECEGVWLDKGELEQVADLKKSVFDVFFGAFKPETRPEAYHG